MEVMMMTMVMVMEDTMMNMDGHGGHHDEYGYGDDDDYGHEGDYGYGDSNSYGGHQGEHAEYGYGDDDDNGYSVYTVYNGNKDQYEDKGVYGNDDDDNAYSQNVDSASYTYSTSETTP
eukprot:TRINITY_DN57_c0_g1_i13.p2 TRINITY_DN57_c0_g1~~TRINITY_DN57_c0_g1_i13.p2  ORF type:complete len:118 (-),score=36.02 TRINITY_DN57_c0_g1_i13:62-415(-)